MKNYSAEYAAHILQPVTTLAICWRVVKRNGELILATTHDRDIVITQTNIGVSTGSPSFELSGAYRAKTAISGAEVKSSSDTSVDNTEITGAVEQLGQLDISVYDMEAGLLDSAEATIFKVNWQNPDNFQDVLRHGFLGELTRTAEGAYKTEHRGLTQLLQQVIGRNCGDRCDVREFGDSRCKIDLAAVSVSGTITSVTSNRAFNTSLLFGSPTPAAGYFNLGKLTWLTGANATYVGQVKQDDVGGTHGNLLMWEEFPTDVQIGDTFMLAPGCDRRYETCKNVHNNLINFRGPGYFTPGKDSIIRAP